MKPINNIVVVEPLTTEKENNILLPGVNQGSGWKPKKDIEVMRILSATASNLMDNYVGKLAIVESTQVKTVVHKDKIQYFIDARFIYGFIDD
jgi:hypothetical protein